MSSPHIHQAIIDQLIQPKIFIRVSSIMTPRRKLVSVCLDDRVKEALVKAKEGAFDQLPVLDKKAGIVGLISVDELQDCSSEAMVSEYFVPLAKCKPLQTKDGISKTLRTLHKQPSSLVADKNKVTGLVDRSDLNKHPARAYFYVWLSSLEMELARFIDTRRPKNSWIGLLSKKTQIQVLGNTEYERRRGNNTPPIEYLDLSDLTMIIAKNEALRCELGFSSREKFNKHVGGLIDLRQTIMHPVRTLVSDADSMDTLVKREKRLRSFRLTVRRILK